MSDRATQPQRITKHDLEVVVEAMDKLRDALQVEEEEKSALPEQISGHEWVCVTTSGWRGMCSCGQFGQDSPRRLVTHAEWQAHLASVAQAAPPSVDGLEARHASYCALSMDPNATTCDCQPAKVLSELLCPPHANLDAIGHLEPFDNCIACIRVERDVLAPVTVS